MSEQVESVRTSPTTIMQSRVMRLIAFGLPADRTSDRYHASGGPTAATAISGLSSGTALGVVHLCCAKIAFLS